MAVVMQALIQAVQDMVLDHPTMSADDICKAAFGVNPDTGKANKSHWTLYREINPNDDGAKLSYVSLVQLMKVCGPRPLEIMAAELGKVLSDAPDGVAAISEDDARERLAEAQIRLGRVLDKLHSALMDDRLTNEEMTDLFFHAYDALNSIASFGIGVHKAMQQ